MARDKQADRSPNPTELFRNSTASVLTEYRGLTVSQLKELRRSLSGRAPYAVVKNTLTRIAPGRRRRGHRRFAVGTERSRSSRATRWRPRRGLRAFAKEHPAPDRQGRRDGGQGPPPKRSTKLADLESREVLLKLAGAMKASCRTLCRCSLHLCRTARAVEALRAKVEAEGPVAEEPRCEAFRGAPAAEATEDAAPEAGGSPAADTTRAPNNPHHHATHPKPGTPEKRKERHHGEAVHR